MDIIDEIGDTPQTLSWAKVMKLYRYAKNMRAQLAESKAAYDTLAETDTAMLRELRKEIQRLTIEKDYVCNEAERRQLKEIERLKSELADMSERRQTLQGRVIELIEQRDRFVKCLQDVRESLAEDISGGDEFDKLFSAQYIREVLEMLV